MLPYNLSVTSPLEILLNAMQAVMAASLDEAAVLSILAAAVLGIVFMFLRLLYMITMMVIVRGMRKLFNAHVNAIAPPLHPNGKRVLIVGDSTARGTGAKSSQETIAGRLRKDFPAVEIYNRAVDGARTQDVLSQLEPIRDQKFDIIFVATGGNDIWRLTNLNQLRRALSATLAEAIRMSNHRVFVLFYANFGLAPILPPVIMWYLRYRTRRVHDVFSEVCAEMKVPCIELFTEFTDRVFDSNGFAQDPKRYFAADFTHPSGEGYGLWYTRLWRKMVENGYASGLSD